MTMVSELGEGNTVAAADDSWAGEDIPEKEEATKVLFGSDIGPRASCSGELVEEISKHLNPKGLYH